MQGLLTRALTGAVFVGIIVAAIYISPYSFVLLFGGITALCLFEFLNTVLIKDRKIAADRIFTGTLSAK